MRRLVSSIIIIALLCGLVPAFAAGDITVSTSIAGMSSGRISNIEIAAASIDGVYVPSGSYFSFNDVVGPRTSAYGYVTAKNGRGVKVRGGGVSQVATTLYLALLKASNIEFDEVKTYGSRFKLNYVSDGEMAIVTDYSNGVDFSFYNDGDDMTISMWTDNNNLYCELSYDVSHNSSDVMPDYGVITRGGFYVSGKKGLKSNIERAANAISGTVLYPGDSFSFNDTVGPRTERNGYVEAINGRGVKVIGGGVAQVASALWLAVKYYDDVVITDISTYGKKYNQDYVASREDAILTDYKADIDFAFRYVGDEPVMIMFTFENDYLECAIYYLYTNGDEDDYSWIPEINTPEPDDDGDDDWLNW